jgi:hypothetical protein
MITTASTTRQSQELQDSQWSTECWKLPKC